MKGWIAVLAVLFMSTLAYAEVIQLAWGPPAAGTPTGYRLYRSINGAAFAVLSTASTIPATQTTFTDTLPERGTNCYYITALDAQGESVPSNTACKSLEAGQLPVSAPQALRITNP